jgi:hypothetical protein
MLHTYEFGNYCRKYLGSFAGICDWLIENVDTRDE